MWNPLVAAASAAARKMAISDPQRRNRRGHRPPSVLPETPNSDFDFGSVPSPLAIGKPPARERLVSYLVVAVILILAAAPIFFLVLSAL